MNAFRMIFVCISLLLVGCATTIQPTNEALRGEKSPEKDQPGWTRFFICSPEEEKLCEAFDYALKNYPDLPPSEIAERFIHGGIVALGDPYAKYIPKEEQACATSSDGSYGGVGIRLGEKESVSGKVIVADKVYSETPASRAGVQRGDTIRKINGIPVPAAATASSVADLIRGSIGSVVHVTLESCSGQVRNLSLQREKIPSSTSVEIHELQGYIYLSLDDFERGTTQNAKAKLLRSLKRNSTPGGLIIDLRNNPGGYTLEAVEFASLFIGKNTVLYETRRGKDPTPWKSDHDEISLLRETPIVVLVNKKTGSAAEIVSGALQDTGRAKILGNTTYGKGVMQGTKELSDGSAIKITVSHYTTPNLRDVNGRGITPDISIGEISYCSGGDDILAGAIFFLDQIRKRGKSI